MDVLSIDFDIIMAPTIEYYNHMTPQRSWEDMQQENPYLIAPKMDLEHYNYLICLLNKVIDENTEVYVAFNHKMIVDFLKNDTDLSIINIDHHHDLSYNPNEEKQNPDCANWAKYLFEQNKMRNYVWAKNANSQMPIDIVVDQIKNYNYVIEDFNNIKDRIDNIKYQKVFICLSPEWVPPYCQTLFFGLLDMLNNKFNCHLEIHEES